MAADLLKGVAHLYSFPKMNTACFTQIEIR